METFEVLPLLYHFFIISLSLVKFRKFEENIEQLEVLSCFMIYHFKDKPMIP